MSSPRGLAREEPAEDAFQPGQKPKAKSPAAHDPSGQSAVWLAFWVLFSLTPLLLGMALRAHAQHVHSSAPLRRPYEHAPPPALRVAASPPMPAHRAGRVAASKSPKLHGLALIESGTDILLEELQELRSELADFERGVQLGASKSTVAAAKAWVRDVNHEGGIWKQPRSLLLPQVDASGVGCRSSRPGDSTSAGCDTWCDEGQTKDHCMWCKCAACKYC